jgi:hypothetical protein
VSILQTALDTAFKRPPLADIVVPYNVRCGFMLTTKPITDAANLSQMKRLVARPHHTIDEFRA